MAATSPLGSYGFWWLKTKQPRPCKTISFDFLFLTFFSLPFFLCNWNGYRNGNGRLNYFFELILTKVDGSGLCWDLVVWYCLTRRNPARHSLYLQLLESLLSRFSPASLLLLLSEHEMPAPKLYTKNYRIGPGLSTLCICQLDPTLGFPRQLASNSPPPS